MHKFGFGINKLQKRNARPDNRERESAAMAAAAAEAVVAFCFEQHARVYFSVGDVERELCAEQRRMKELSGSVG